MNKQHKETSIPWPDPTRFIEAHGRLGLFKCVAEGGADGDRDNECPFSWDKEVPSSAFPPATREALEGDPHTATATGLGSSLTEIPRYDARWKGTVENEENVFVVVSKDG